MQAVQHRVDNPADAAGPSGGSHRWQVWRKALAWSLACVVIPLWVVACGGGGGGGPVGGATQAPGAATIGSAGGTVTEASGASVVVPANAFSVATTVRIAKDSTGAPALPTALTSSGNVYMVTPHGGTFAQPVEVRIPAPNVELLPTEELKLAKAEPGGGWVVLGDSVLVGGVLSAKVDSFSFFLPVTVSYVLPLAQLAPLQVSTSLDCGAQNCGAALGTVVATYTVTTNSGVLPANCANGSLRTQDGNSSSWNTSGGSGQGGLALGGGSLTRTLSPRANSYSFLVGLNCQSYSYTLGYGKAVTWKWQPSYPDISVLSSPMQLDVIAGSNAGLVVVLAGGASKFDTNHYTLPTGTDRAIVDWQRSDDGGASWQTIARSYQDEANPSPVGTGFDWRYWSVSHGFIASAADQGALIRVYACYTPPDVAAPPCVTGPSTRLNVLLQSALPTITDAPRSLLVRTGQTASLSATAGGVPTPTLQWQSRPANSTGAWTNVASGTGGTTGSYTTDVLALSDNGMQLRVVATNAVSSVESTPATVSVSDVDVAPSISTQPGNLNVSIGNDAAFAIAARGTEAMSYQWEVNGVPISGANSPVLRLTAVTNGQAGSYRVVVSNATGTVTSDAATLTVTSGAAAATAPTIVTQPVPVTVNAGNTATFAVGVSGTGPFTYQWLKGGQPINGATAAFYSIASAAVGDAGSYSVRVTNSVNTATSSSASLTVNANPVVSAVSITSQPSPQIQLPGGSATFAVAAIGTGPFSYQWLKGGSPISGATDGVLLLANLLASDAADYSVTVSNSLGGVTSNAASLTVVGAPAINTQPANVSASAGVTATFNVSATGTNLRYQWTLNSVGIGGATSASYTTPTLSLADNGAVYGVLVYNGAGLIFSQSAVLTVTAAPSGGLVLVANSGVTNGSNGLSVYRADATTGALSFLSNINAGNTPYAVAVTPNGLYAYVSNQMGDSVSEYSVDSATGVVSLLGARASNNASGMAMDRLGRYLWVANYGWHTLSEFSIGSGGLLTPIVGSPLATTSSLPYAITAHPTMDFVYVAFQSTANHSVAAYSVDPATGALTLLQTLTNVISSANGIAIDPLGRFLYVNDGSGICTFAISPTSGQLTSKGCASPGGSTFALAVNPNGQYVYVVTDSTSNNLVVFAVNPTSGALTQVGSPVSAGSNPRGVTVNAAGTHLYVTNYVSSNVSTFSVSASGATLTASGSAIATGSSPQGIAIAP